MNGETHLCDESITLAYCEMSIRDEVVNLRLLVHGRKARVERNQIQPDGTVLSMTYLIADSRGLSEFCAADPYHWHAREAYSQIQERYERFADA